LAHIDHQLRPSSKADAAVARELAGVLKLPFHLREVRIEAGEGVEGGARRARYAALAEVAHSLGASCVAVGHSRTDQAETVLLRLFRGAGLRGLSAMAPSRRLSDGVQLVRPLLGVSRDELRAYGASLELPSCEDPTNLDLRFRRNALRALWPQLLALSPQLEQRLAQLADLVRDDERALEALAAAAFENLVSPAEEAGFAGRRAEAEGRSIRTYEAKAEAVAALPPAVARRVVRKLAARVEPRAQLTAVQVNRILHLLELPKPGEAHVAGDLTANVWKGVLRLGRRLRAAPAESFSISIAGEGRWPCPAGGMAVTVRRARVDGTDDASVLYLAIDTHFPLELRSRRPGDRFHPQGAPGSRKLKAFLIDEGVANDQRDRLPLLCANGEILWVVGVRVGQRAPRPVTGTEAWAVRVEPL
jgi:tRNA(Ile)-lysidine synthase